MESYGRVVLEYAKAEIARVADMMAGNFLGHMFRLGGTSARSVSLDPHENLTHPKQGEIALYVEMQIDGDDYIVCLTGSTNEMLDYTNLLRMRYCSRGGKMPLATAMGIGDLDVSGSVRVTRTPVK